MAKSGRMRATRLEGVEFRSFRSSKDYAEISRVMNASWKADHVKWSQTPKDVKLYYHRMKGFDPKRCFFIAEVKGRMTGCSYIAWRTKPDGAREYSLQSQVVPEWRGTGLREALLGLAEDRARGLAKRHSAPRKYLDAWASFDENEWKSLLESRGYAAESHMLNMLNTHLEEARPLPLPPGIEVRRVEPEHYRRIWNASKEALREEPNYSDQAWTESAFRDHMKADTFSPHMWQIAWDGDEVVGGVHNFLDPHDVEAFGKRWCRTERIFVRKPWRRKGIASALISRSLIVLREAKMEGAMLMVDVNNPSKALKFYTKMGYETIEHFAFFRKGIGEENRGRARRRK
jgi:GNAT superfamily N-acetyltransferase